ATTTADDAFSAYLGAFVEALTTELESLSFSPSISLCPDDTCPQDSDFVIVWGAFPAYLATIPPTCKAILSFGAGVDHLVSESKVSLIPRGVDGNRIPVVRLTDDALAHAMSEYVLYNVLRYTTQAHTYAVSQRKSLWSCPDHPYRPRVGFLGYGRLARHCHEAGKAFMHNVSVWTRSGTDPLQTHPTLEAFLSSTDILVVLCPLTKETRHILDETTLSMLPRGACVINAARGAVIDTEGLKAVLAKGHLSFAALDVFETEPLPPSDSLWSMDNVYITPHVAAITHPESAAADMAGKIRQLCDGVTDVKGLVDMDRLY
ncbi:hypothetical protein KIPB_009120, partial [Kipferlia bialata]